MFKSRVLRHVPCLLTFSIVLCAWSGAFATISFSNNTLTYSSTSDLSTTIDPSGQKEVATSYGVSKASFQALNPQIVAFNSAPTASQTLRTLVANYDATNTVTFTFPTAMYNYGSATNYGRGSFSGSNARHAISTVPVQNGSLYDWFDATITSTGGRGVQSLGFCAAFRNDQAVSAGQILYTLSDASTEYITLPTLGAPGNPEYVFIGYTAPTGKTITRVQASRTSLPGGGYVSVDDLSFVMSPPPTVTLSRNNASIAEASGVCTLTATLSFPSTQTVTVNLGYTGTAVQGTDYTAANSITINAGNLTGTTNITATQDALYEGNETVVVDITSVTNAAENGTQQVSTSITDDDSQPSVTLSRNSASIAEAAGVSTLTATLSNASTQNVTVNLGYTGTATGGGTDYTAASSITVTAGNLTGTTNITATQDSSVEGNETIIVDITGVTNGTESGTQQVTVTITDDDGGPTIVALKRDSGLDTSGAIDSRFLTAAVRTVTVADAGLTDMSSWTWFNYGATATGGGNTLFKFNLSSIPTGSTINLAQLRLYHSGGNGGLGNGDVSMVLTHDWMEGTQTGGYPGGAGGASFAHPMGYNTAAYQNASGGGSAPLQSWGATNDQFFSLTGDAGSPIAPFSAPTGTGYHVFDVTSHVQQWVSGTKPNYGWANASGYWDFHCSEAGTALEPVLFVDYGSGGGGDTTAPAAVSNLAAGSPTTSSLTLTWTAPGDDGSTGTATTYDIRYRTGGAVDAGNWASATQCIGEPTPLAAGNGQSFVVTGLSAGTTYYFAIRTADEVPNWSGLSNSPSGTTSALGSSTIKAFKRHAGLAGGGDIDQRFNGSTVQTVTVSDAGLSGFGFGRWYNLGASAIPDGYKLYKFDVSSIPADSTINLAQLRLYHTTGNGTYGDGDIYRVLTHDWTEGTADNTYPGAAGGVTCAHPNCYCTGPNQNVSGGDTPPLMTWGLNSDSYFTLDGDAGLRVVPSSAPTGEGYTVINVTNHVQQWVNGLFPNYGFVQDPGSFNSHASEAGTALEPVLFVDYTPGGGSDMTPPAAVSNLATTSPTSTSLMLTWTAPGDDGNTGTAVSYDLRYRIGGVVDNTNWIYATQATGEPAPTAAGTNQSMTINGLTPGTTYYFAIKTTDDAPLTSLISNSPWGTTSQETDATAPAAVNNLACSNPSVGTITLTWTAPGDDNGIGTASFYDIRYRTGGAVNDGNWAAATKVTGEPAPGLAGSTQRMTVSNLSANTTYYFAIKTTDNLANTSAISNSPSATTLSVSGNKPVLSPKDLKYKGYYIVESNSELSQLIYGQGFTHRYVGGQLRFLTYAFYGNVLPPAVGGFQLIEFAPPAGGLGGTVTTKTNHWQDIFGSTGMAFGLGVWGGLWYEQSQERLWTTWAVDYPDDTMLYWSRSLVLRTLNSDGTISNVQGPYGLAGVGQRRVYGGVQKLSSWFQTTYGCPPYAVGWGGVASRGGAGLVISCGPTFYAVPEPTGYPTGDDGIPTSAFKTIMDYSGAVPASSDWYSYGWPTTCDRGVRNGDVMNIFEVGQWLSPAPDGLGRWTQEDSNWNTGCWIDTPTKQGFITVPKMYAGASWYEASVPHCDRETAEIQIFDPNVLGQAAQASRACWDTQPTYRWQIADICRPLGLLGARSGNSTNGGPCGATYDSTTQTLYVYCTGGTNANSYILVYDVDLQSGAVDDVALAEISTCGTTINGTTSSNRTNTETNDGAYEAVYESLLGGTSQLDHKWIFNVTGGSSVVFNVKAYHNSNSDGDNFVFAYSTNGTSWTNMVTVTKTADDGNFQTYALPGGTSGTVYVRVQDSDRTAGHNNLDSIYIDEICIRSNP